MYHLSNKCPCQKNGNTHLCSLCLRKLIASPSIYSTALSEKKKHFPKNLGKKNSHDKAQETSVVLVVTSWKFNNVTNSTQRGICSPFQQFIFGR